MNKRLKRLSIVKKLIAAAVVIFLAHSFYGIFGKINDYNDQLSVIDKKIAVEKDKLNKLEDEKSKMHSDDNYRKIARETLGLVNPGDKVYINSNDNTGK